LPLQLDPLRIHLDYDPKQFPDWEAGSRNIKAMPGCVVCEALSPAEKIGSLYVPDRVKHTYYEDDEPFAGFEPSLGVVLSAGLGCWLKPGQIVVMRDGDGLEFDEFSAGDYQSKQPVRFFGIIVPEECLEPGYVEEMPWEESILAVVENMDIKQMTGKNILLERDEDDLSRKTDGGLILPDVVSENATSIATVVMTGELVNGCKVGDRVVYHPLGTLDFYDEAHKNRRVVREMAILAVV